MIRHLRPALTLFVFFFLLTGLVYPWAVLQIGQTFFSDASQGSLIRDKGLVIGSSLIGQNFVRDDYFHPRPSAAGSGYDASNSAASNLAPSSTDLTKVVSERIADLRKTSMLGPIPVDLVTASGSGLDPHISPDAAFFQAPRIAEARHKDLADIKALIEQNTEGKWLGVLGEPRVNVLQLNRALDRLGSS